MKGAREGGLEGEKPGESESERKREKERCATDVYGSVDKTGLNHHGTRWISAAVEVEEVGKK